MISSTHRQRSFWPSCSLPALLVTATLFLGGCAGTSSGPYHTTAYQATTPSNVKVKVSLKTQNVYVMEGDRCLLAMPTCVGKQGYPTPQGSFHVISKNATKRSQTYGYWVKGSEAHPGKASESPGAGWTYVGYPMAYWIEFEPGYGFHEGPVWPYPRSHGCLHVHESASAKFFQLVQIGTPVIISDVLPEDATLGREVKRPTDYADPDPPAELMISPKFFEKPRDKDLLPPPATAK